MGFNPNIPQGTDNLSNSQVQILNNFSALNTIFANDHHTWNDTASGYQGLHKQVNIPTNSSSPSGLGAAEIVIYNSSLGSGAEPYLANATTAAGQGAMWYGGTGTGFVTSDQDDTGHVSFPNGIKIAWGSVAPGSSGKGPFTITPPSDYFQNIWNVQFTMAIDQSFSNNASLGQINHSGLYVSNFTFWLGSSSISSLNVDWVAIGN